MVLRLVLAWVDKLHLWIILFSHEAPAVSAPAETRSSRTDLAIDRPPWLFLPDHHDGHSQDAPVDRSPGQFVLSDATIYAYGSSCDRPLERYTPG